MLVEGTPFHGPPTTRSLHPPPSSDRLAGRRESLVKVLVEILWKARGPQNASSERKLRRNAGAGARSTVLHGVRCFLRRRLQVGFQSQELKVESVRGAALSSNHWYSGFWSVHELWSGWPTCSENVARRCPASNVPWAYRPVAPNERAPWFPPFPHRPRNRPRQTRKGPGDGHHPCDDQGELCRSNQNAQDGAKLPSETLLIFQQPQKNIEHLFGWPRSSCLSDSITPFRRRTRIPLVLERRLKRPASKCCCPWHSQMPC